LLEQKKVPKAQGTSSTRKRLSTPLAPSLFEQASAFEDAPSRNPALEICGRVNAAGAFAIHTLLVPNPEKQKEEVLVSGLL
jgi:hypothetical protein